MEEIGGSIQIIHQYLQKRPSGPIRTDNAKQAYPSKDEVYYSMEGMINDFMMTDIGICPPEGAESYHAVESPKGEDRKSTRLNSSHVDISYDVIDLIIMRYIN